MAKLIALILVTVVALITAEDQPAPIDARVEIVQDIATFKTANPGVELIPLDIAKSSTRQQIVYSVGNRVSGDRLVAADSNGQSWATLQDVALTLNYPRSGTGAVVTYVQVVVNQSSNQGRGYIAAGGIGQRRISLVIEAYRTNYFNYNAQIYGY
uniref:Putative transcription activator mbf2 n=1 Tax=Culex tarsalis TaxID=7177 RepID=A0A1Q3FN42_CULTA